MKKLVLSLLAFSALSASAQMPTDGLLLHYNFNGNFNDQTGNDFDATSSSGLDFVGGEYAVETYDSICNFQNTNSKLQFDYAGKESLFESGSFTCLARVYVDGLDAYNNIMEIGDFSTGDVIYFRFRLAPGNILFLQSGHSAVGGTAGEYNIPYNPVGSYLNLTFTSELTTPGGSARVYRMYINNAMVNEKFAVADFPYPATDKKINIGCRVQGSTGSLSWYGKMAEFAYYNKALSLSEIQDFWLWCKYANTIKQNGNALSGSPVEQVEHQWYNCATGNIIAGETNKDFIPTTDGDYAVITTFQGVSYNCEADTSECFNFIFNGGGTNGIDENSQATFSIFPNPSNGFVTISTTQIGGTIKIADATGRLVSSKRISSENTTIDISENNSGFYFVSILGTDGTSTIKKLIVRK